MKEIGHNPVKRRPCGKCAAPVLCQKHPIRSLVRIHEVRRSQHQVITEGT